MVGELTKEALEDIVVKGKGGQCSHMQADLEDSKEIIAASSKEEFFQTYKCLHPLQMMTTWNSVCVYAESLWEAIAPNIGLKLQKYNLLGKNDFFFNNDDRVQLRKINFQVHLGYFREPKPILL
ncbi:hypothetical protein FS749_015945 [Ceratobasidium sp. UAMH 11750]|nr:hypothetical protein FS749_015945 [Ceratobasidium sp. UAMH 11750]